MKKAMIIIEALIALLILFIVVVTSFSNLKFLNSLNLKKQSYEDYYMVSSSIKDKLASTICEDTNIKSGEFNEFTFKASCEKIKQLRTYVVAIDEDEVSGNFGAYLMYLNLVNLEISKDNIVKNYSYYKTIYKKI